MHYSGHLWFFINHGNYYKGSVSAISGAGVDQGSALALPLTSQVAHNESGPAERGGALTYTVVICRFALQTK